MGLSKASHPIRVGATGYRWIVSSEDGFMVVVVQKATGKGSRLRARVNWDDIVSPSMVRKIILEGLKHGWDPDRPEKASKKRRIAKDTRPEGYACPSCSQPAFRYRAPGFFKCRSCGKSLD